MFDILAPVRKLATILALIAFFVVANAALLYALSGCISSPACIGTGTTAGIVIKMKAIAGLFLPGNFYPCVQAMVLAMVARRAYDYAMKLMTFSASAT